MRPLIFPLPPPQYDQGYLTRVLENLRTTLRGAVSKEEAVDGILLQSPDGSVWRLSVDNTGAVTTTQVPLGR
jgi:hypothetical protein